MGRLDGRKCVITGGAQGQGRAAARRFGEEGADVVVLDLSAPTDDVPFVQGDITDEQQMAAVAEDIASRWGELHVLYHVAGYDAWEGPLHEASVDAIRKTIEVNLVGAILCTRALLPVMLSTAGDRCILFTSSIAGNKAFPGMPGYSASKAGLLGLTRSLAAGVADDGIRVNAICPGFIQSERVRELMSNPERRRMATGAEPRLPVEGQPEDIANLALYLASEEARFASGQTFTLDGAATV